MEDPETSASAPGNTFVGSLGVGFVEGTTHSVPERSVRPGLSARDSLTGCLVAVPVAVTGILFVAQDLVPGRVAAAHEYHDGTERSARGSDEDPLLHRPGRG